MSNSLTGVDARMEQRSFGIEGLPTGSTACWSAWAPTVTAETPVASRTLSIGGQCATLACN